MTAPPDSPTLPRFDTPPLAQLLRQPKAFYAALTALSAQPWRYVGLVLLTGLVSGIGAALLGRTTVQAQSSLQVPGLSAPMTYATLIFSGVFLMLVSWLLLWFLGNLGAGSKGRAAEVYGATFTVQLIWSLVMLIVGLVVHPTITVHAPNLQGLDAQHSALAVQRFNQAVAAQVADQPLIKVSNILGYAVYLWQLALAYLGFQATTADKRKAQLGVVYPAATFVILLLALWLLNQAAGQLLGMQ